MTEQLDQVKKAVEKAIKDFEQCLTEGVKNSKTSEENLNTFLHRDENPLVFMTLEAVVKKNGIHKTKKGEEINLNTMLASCLTDSIDEKFRKTFPNDVKGRYFNGVISIFSLDTKPLIQEYQDVKLQLIFLQTEEERIKAKLNKIILKEKKVIYNSLTETIVKSMQKGYDDAKAKRQKEDMRNTLETHVSSNRNMYEDAKKTMLEKMDTLKTTICNELKETMEHSIKLSFKVDVCPLPDVSKHLKTVQRYHDEVKKREREMPAQ
ncbi:uncharacterized protein LOC112844476 [Oreochromis niloticus]|uniref:uncharacterized protein LOC112844476 n=1 Tax=Oreochromis niloticus TaxID=8128 RepID=UPI000DF1F4E8|nr:uncharacterized protein LOC112844476 [Oreochromis niloticus]